MIPRRLWVAALRHHRLHPLQLALSVVGVALGVAAVLAIDLTVESAQRAFRDSLETITGRTTHHVMGGPRGVDENLYAALERRPGLPPMAPVVVAAVTLEAPVRATFQLIGIDPYSESSVRRWPGLSGGSPWGELVTRPGAALLSRFEAERLGVEEGDALTVRVGSRLQRLEVVELAEPRTAFDRRRMAGVLLVDIATAQEITGSVGWLTRIDAVVASPATEELAELEKLLPEGVFVVDAASRNAALLRMAGAFRLNLRSLTLLALIVGAFLIYNAMTLSVVQRRELFGRLRALGVTRREIFGLVLGEAAVLGVVATAIGLGLGWFLARALLGVVSATVQDLYFAAPVHEVAAGFGEPVRAALLGVLTPLVATLSPAREAARPEATDAARRAALEETAGRRARVGVGLALLLGIAATVSVVAPIRSPVPGYVALMLLVLGFALVTPALTSLLARLMSGPAGWLRGVTGRMAARNVSRHLSRTGVATTALAVAIAMSIGVGVMIRSFRGSVEEWLGETLGADIYVSTPAVVPRRGSETPLPAAAVELWSQRHDIARIGSNRVLTVESNLGAVRLSALDLGGAERPSLRLERGELAERWSDFGATEEVLISEPFAFRHGLDVGDSVELITDAGARRFSIRGVFLDYASEEGYVVMARWAYDRHWNDPGVTALALFVDAGAEVDAIVDGLRRQAAEHGWVLNIRSNVALRSASLEIFDRTFTVTAVLRTLALIVAVIGVLGALMALQLERRREFAILRAHGLSRLGIWSLVSAESGILGLTSGVLSIPLGIAFAAVLTLVINERSFGWSLELQLPLDVILLGPVLALGAALAAGLYPAWRACRTGPAEALRTE